MVRTDQIHISHSVKNAINQNRYKVTINHDFENVILRCASVLRKGQGGGTWIIREMIDAYIALHKSGYAHSVEVMEGDKLVGGLYGIAVGKIFFGESMFSEKSNASKVGFVFFANHLRELGFEWIDCQQDTPHMRTLGANLVEEDDFLTILRKNQLFTLKHPSQLPI